MVKMKAYIINSQIKYDTGKASLITLPHTNKKVWISNKLIFDKNNYSKIVYLPEDFEFNGVSGKNNKFKISAQQVYDAFSGTDAPNKSNKPKEYIEKYIPEHIDPVEVSVDDDLKR